MSKEEFKFFEYCRIVLSKELEIPPDDINLIPIFNCIKRGIIKSINSSVCDDEITLIPENEDEEEMLYKNEHAPIIIDRILSKEPPFYDWIDRYQMEYIKEYLKKTNKKGKE